MLSNINNMPERKSPPQSATLFKPGTIKIGSDGNKWIVKSYDSVNRWIKHDDYFKIKLGTIINFNFDIMLKKLKLPEPKKVGSIKLSSSKIAIGESLFNTYSATKGLYNIFALDYSLIAVPEGSSVKNLVFKQVKGHAVCDWGTFMFGDAKNIIKYTGGKNKNSQYRFPMTKKGEAKYGEKQYYLYESSFESSYQNKKFFDEVVDESNPNPVALFVTNGYGDNDFNIYRAKSTKGYIYMIMSFSLESKIKK